jgi:hypothetical protein
VGLPFLKYEVTDSYTLTKGFNGINVSPVFDPAINSDTQVSILPLYIAIYNTNGTYVAFKKLEGELLLCPHPSVDNDRSHMFGVDYTLDCTIDMNYFANYEQPTYVYELFLKDGNRFIDVPVAIQSDVSEKQYDDNDLKNAKGIQFYRRFYLIDRATGIVAKTDDDVIDTNQCQNLEGNKPNVVRFATTIKLYLDSQVGSIDRFSRPYLFVKYSNSAKETGPVRVSYRSVYFMNMPTFYNAFLGILIAILVIALLVTAGRIWIWTVLNPSEAAGTRDSAIPNRGSQLVKTSLYYIIETFGLALFAFLVILSFYIYAFYKWQKGVFMLLPSEDEYPERYVAFYVIFAICCFLILLSNVVAIFRQSFSDIFFIDWVDRPQKGISFYLGAATEQDEEARAERLEDSAGGQRVQRAYDRAVGVL